MTESRISMTRRRRMILGMIGAPFVALLGCTAESSTLTQDAVPAKPGDAAAVVDVLRAGSRCNEAENLAIDRVAKARLPANSKPRDRGREGVWLCNATLVYIDADAMPPIDHSKNWVVEAYLQPTGDETAGMVDLGVGQRMP